MIIINYKFIKAKNLKKGDTIVETEQNSSILHKVTSCGVNTERRVMETVCVSKTRKTGFERERYFSFFLDDKITKLITLTDILEKL